MAVREMNASLTTINGDLTVELQEAKDKLYKIQVGWGVFTLLLLKTKSLGSGNQFCYFGFPQYFL